MSAQWTNISIRHNLCKHIIHNTTFNCHHDKVRVRISTLADERASVPEQGAVLWLTLSLLLCKHSSYWVTNYLPQTNRCLIWFQVFNCTVEIMHYTPLTAAFGSSQLCLQVQSLRYSFQIDLCVSLLLIQRVHYSSAGQLTMLSVE